MSQPRLDLVLFPEVILFVEIELRVDGLHLSLHTWGIKQRVREELREPIQGALQGIVGDLENIICVETAGEGIGVAWILWDVVLVLGLVGVLGGPHEQHML